MNEEKFRCCICGQVFEGYGNNPYPVSFDPNDRCCDICNEMRVVPERILRAYASLRKPKETGE